MIIDLINKMKANKDYRDGFATAAGLAILALILAVMYKHVKDNQ